MDLQEPPPDFPKPIAERPRPTSAARAKGLDLSAAYQAAGDCCDGCQLLLGSGNADGDGQAVDDGAIVAEVENALDNMSAWERIAAVHSWNQIGGRELQAERWVAAGQAYIRALAFAQALSYHGPLVASCASWAPAEMQQLEVQRLCGEVYTGIALLQLRRERAEADASENERAILMQKAIEAADRAIELNAGNVQAHTRRGVANLRIAQLPCFSADREHLLSTGQSSLQIALQHQPRIKPHELEELRAACVEAAAATES